MKKRVIIVFVLMIGIIIIGCNERVPIGNTPKNENLSGIISKEECNNTGGNWNECGSPCAGTGAEVCIQVCKAQCECGGIAGFKCPAGYRCRLSGKKADEMGVCVPN